MMDRSRVQTARDVTQVKACVSSCIDKHAPILLSNPADALRRIVPCVQECVKPRPDPALMAACVAEKKVCMDKAKDSYSADAKTCTDEGNKCIGNLLPHPHMTVRAAEPERGS